MFIVTVKSIDADSLALPTLYGKTTLQNYNFSTNPQGEGRKCFSFGRFRKACHPDVGMCESKGSMLSEAAMKRSPFYMGSMCVNKC